MSNVFNTNRQTLIDTHNPLLAEPPIVLSSFRRTHGVKRVDSSGTEARIGLAVVTLAFVLGALMLTSQWPVERVAQNPQPAGASSLSTIYDTSTGVRRM